MVAFQVGDFNSNCITFFTSSKSILICLISFIYFACSAAYLSLSESAQVGGEFLFILIDYASHLCASLFSILSESTPHIFLYSLLQPSIEFSILALVYLFFVIFSANFREEFLIIYDHFLDAHPQSNLILYEFHFCNSTTS